MTGRVDRAERTVLAPAAAVFAALTDPEAVVAWLPPSGMSARIDRFEPLPGGAYDLTLTYTDGGEGKSTGDTDVVRGRFVALEPDRLVVTAINFRSDDPRFAGEMTMRWTIEAAGAGATLRLECTGVPEGIDHDVHEAALAETLGNLAALLERRT